MILSLTELKTELLTRALTEIVTTFDRLEPLIIVCAV
jgi:hypothetical protein